jgi:hypothetical protein
VTREQFVLEISRDPVFVIGCPRSGTSMLAWALAQHSEFSTSPETDFLFHLYGRGRLREALQAMAASGDSGWLLQKGVSREEFFEAVGIGLNSLITSRADGRRWIDQSPTYTLMAPELLELFPGAQFLHIVRDGRSVVHSMINSGFAKAWASDFERACATWADFVRAGSSFAAAAPDRCLTVRYAELTADPDQGFSSILRFLGVEWEPEPATFVRTNRINSSYQPDGAIAASRYRGPAEPWRLWSDKQRRIFVRTAGAALVAYGFASEQDLAVAV